MVIVTGLGQARAFTDVAPRLMLHRLVVDAGHQRFTLATDIKVYF